MKALLFFSTLLVLATGCSTNFAWKDPKIDLRQRKSYYVEPELSDGRSLHKAIAEELRQLGYEADYGQITLMPKTADTLVSYQARWTWDFTTYLIELNIQVRDARTGRIIASSDYHRPALKGTSTEEVIHHAVVSIFAPKSPTGTTAVKPTASPSAPKP